MLNQVVSKVLTRPVAVPALPQPASVVKPKRATPLPNCLIRDDQTAFDEEICDISEAQAETVVEPDGVTDDFRGTSVSAIAEGWLVIGRLCHVRLNLTPPFGMLVSYRGRIVEHKLLAVRGETPRRTEHGDAPG